LLFGLLGVDAETGDCLGLDFFRGRARVACTSQAGRLTTCFEVFLLHNQKSERLLKAKVDREHLRLSWFGFHNTIPTIQLAIGARNTIVRGITSYLSTPAK